MSDYDGSSVINCYFNDWDNTEDEYSLGVGGYWSKNGNPIGINKMCVEENAGRVEILPITQKQILQSKLQWNN